MNVVIIGEGPNGLEIPLRVMESRESAVALLNGMPGVRFQGGIDGKWMYLVDDEYAEGVITVVDEEGCEVLADTPFYNLFKNRHYYAGCGGCYRLVIRELQWDAPLVAWDLD